MNKILYVKHPNSKLVIFVDFLLSIYTIYWVFIHTLGFFFKHKFDFNNRNFRIEVAISILF